MNLMSVKAQIELVVSAIVGGGTTALSIDQFITDSTPIIKYIGLCAGVLLSIVLLIKNLKWKRKK